MTKYKFYMSRYVSGSWETAKSLEDEFQGLKYVKCSGLSAYGKPKNIYTESYAETDELRVFLPQKVARENTDIELELCFIGANRRDIYDSFVEYVTGCKIKFWDDCRNREAQMVLTDAIDPSDDILIGGTPYIIASFKFINCNGQTIKHT